MSIVWFGGAYSGGAASAVDWDTYENGIWQESPVHQTSIYYYTGGYTTYGANKLKSPAVNASTWGDYIESWWSYGQRPTGSMSVGYTIADADPYVAVWDCARGLWLGVEPFGAVGTNRAIYDDGGTRMFSTNSTSIGNTCIFVPLTEDPGDISGWRDYDGPDDWDTWHTGHVLNVPSWNNGAGSIAQTDSTYFDAPLYVNVGGKVGLQYFDIGEYPPYIAVWNETTSSWSVGGVYQVTTTSKDTVTYDIPAPTYTNSVIVLYLSRLPSSVSSWRNYDGPLFASWDEPARQTLVSAVDQSSSSIVNVEYYEDTSFWSSIVQTSGTYIPATLRRDGGTTISMYNAGGSSMNQATLKSLVPRAAVYLTNYTSPYNGWLWSTPTASGSFKAEYPFTVSSGLDFNTFYTYAPIVLNLYSEEIGDIRNWPAYDGPVANWDTYANGVYIIDNLNTSTASLIPVPAYPATTYTDAPTGLAVRSDGLGYYPYNPLYHTGYDGDEAPYIAVYINEYSDTVEDAYSTSAQGWYVFKNDVPSTGTYDRTTYETPIAWPSDTSTSKPTGINDDGYLGSAQGSVGTVGYTVVFLDEYNDPTGSGGTDHWTKPPIVIYGTVNNVDTANDQVNSNDLKRYGQAPGVDVYTINPIRINSNNVDGQWIVNAESPALGVLDTQVFLNGTKISEAPWTHAAQGTGTSSPRLPIDFSTTGVYSDWSDFETNSGITAGDELMLVIYND